MCALKRAIFSGTFLEGRPSILRSEGMSACLSWNFELSMLCRSTMLVVGLAGALFCGSCAGMCELLFRKLLTAFCGANCCCGHTCASIPAVFLVQDLSPRRWAPSGSFRRFPLQAIILPVRGWDKTMQSCRIYTVSVPSAEF